ncbi:hypothetical protein NMG60_11017091 [Bertholletia excelsa]
MGIRGQSGSDRSRTIWTPEMDRYFIDLMLEQVSKGNRINDNLFSKHAWEHMMSSFCAKFKFQYEKDVLKNRHKTLRNLYRAIKNILDQKGFSWDENRKMVTADNKVWDDYIKVHPDARSYRLKTIPYYNDLCVIYKNAITIGKSNISCLDISLDPNTPLLGTGRELQGLESPATNVDDEEQSDNLLALSVISDGNVKTPPSSVGEGATEALHEIMINEDYGVSVSKAGEEMTPQPEADVGSRIGSRSRTYWQPPMDRYFIDLMLDQVHKGNQIDGMFPKQAWTEMIALFNARFGFKYDIDILKNRFKTMKRQYKVIKKLLDLDGFFWDETRQMVTADDSVWQDYIKAHKDSRQYITRPMPYYKDLCVICRGMSINGRESVSGQNLDLQDMVRMQVLQSPTDSGSSGDQVDVQESSPGDLELVYLIKRASVV